MHPTAGVDSSSEEVKQLREEVNALHAKLAQMDANVAQLTGVMERLLTLVPSSNEHDDHNKKRRLGNNGVTVASIAVRNSSVISHESETSTDDNLIDDTDDLTIDSSIGNNTTFGGNSYVDTIPRIPPPPMFLRMNTVDSLVESLGLGNEMDFDDFLDMENSSSPFLMSSLENVPQVTEITEIKSDVLTISTPQHKQLVAKVSTNSLLVDTATEVSNTVTMPICPLERIKHTVCQVMSNLTPEMQLRFVDKLADAIGPQIKQILFSYPPVESNSTNNQSMVISTNILQVSNTLGNMSSLASNTSNSNTRHIPEVEEIEFDPAVAMPICSTALLTLIEFCVKMNIMPSTCKHSVAS